MTDETKKHFDKAATAYNDAIARERAMGERVYAHVRPEDLRLLLDETVRARHMDIAVSKMQYELDTLKADFPDLHARLSAILKTTEKDI